jgi:signal transduction histidine kinase
MESSVELDIVHGYIDTVQEHSRVTAAETYISPDATITINGTELSRPEYLSRIEQSDRVFAPRRTEVLRTIIHGDEVAVFSVTDLEQIEMAYGVEPTDELLTQYESVFYRIADEQIIELDIVTDETSRYRKLGLLSEDPTKEQLQNQYYEVLNRVLRHDLRNRLNVIRLVADSLAEGTAEDTAVAGVKIRRIVDDLLQTTDKARALEQLAIDTEVEPATFRVDSLVESLVGTYCENTDATFSIEYPDDTPFEATSDKKLVWNAINELIENAVVHTDADEPAVTLTVRRPDESRYDCEIQVTDNGPGIPEDVLVPVLDRTETKLFHGSGIGLWIVQWCLTRLDGDLVFEQPESGGTRVRLLLCDLE